MQVMTDAERERVRAALCLSGVEAAAAVAALSNAVQIHQFIENTNVNDGFFPVLAAIRHAQLDRGTATKIFFLFADMLDPKLRASQREENEEFNGNDVMTALEKRFAANDFASSAIYYDVEEAHGSDAMPWLRRHCVDAAMLRPVGQTRIEREWLLDGDD